MTRISKNVNGARRRCADGRGARRRRHAVVKQASWRQTPADEADLMVQWMLDFTGKS
ncbi:MAG: hypothetical protein LBH75_02800 [Treponema sp.]|nr:hypothetical protein [Treponema sp.]